MAISKKSWLGFGVETTPGTALVTPTVFHPCKSIMKGTKKQEKLEDERGTRDDIYGIVDTTRQGAVDPKGHWYNDTSPYLLQAALGQTTTTQVDSVNVPSIRKHSMSLADIPKTLTMFKNYDAVTYIGASAALTKLDIKIDPNGKTIECDTDFMHLYPVKYTGTVITPTFSSAQPFAGYAASITLAGAASTDIDNISVNYAQKVEPWFPASGVPDFTRLDYSGRNVSVDFTARFDTDTFYNHFFTYPRTDDSLTIDVKGAQIGKVITATVGAASAGTFTLSYGGQTTTPIAYNATSAIVQAALVALTTVGTGNVLVTGTGPYTINFTGSTLTDGNTLTGSGTGLTGGAFAVGTQTNYFQELNISIPIISYASMDHDLGKNNVLVKAKANAIAGPTGLISAYVVNTVTSYAV